MTVTCLVCEKPLVFNEEELVEDGGFLQLVFHYGSRHDQCKGFASAVVHDSLLRCDEIEAYICDDCFDKKRGLMKGFDVKTTRKRERKV
jgi:hypothetical protein